MRITHLPTGIVVSMQNEKSQIQNRAAAMRVLQSRLLILQKEQEAATKKELAGTITASWGDQMRSYVLAPYQMVKDLRTDYEVGKPDDVFDGDLDGFIAAGIRWKKRRLTEEDSRRGLRPLSLGSDGSRRHSGERQVHLLRVRVAVLAQELGVDPAPRSRILVRPQFDLDVEPAVVGRETSSIGSRAPGDTTRRPRPSRTARRPVRSTSITQIRRPGHGVPSAWSGAIRTSTTSCRKTSCSERPFGHAPTLTESPDRGVSRPPSGRPVLRLDTP